MLPAVQGHGRTRVGYRGASSLLVSEPIPSDGSIPPATLSAITAAAKFNSPISFLTVTDDSEKKLLNDFEVHAYVGGTVVRNDMHALQDGVHVMVGTPGCVYDMINQHALQLDYIRQSTLNEDGEM